MDLDLITNIWILFCSLVLMGLLIYLIFMPIKQEAREGAVINPWKRYFARGIDNGFYIVIWALAIFVFSYLSAAYTSMEDGTINFIAIFIGIGIGIFTEPLILSKFQTTLGKTLFKLKIHSNEPITFSLAIRRWISVVLRLIPVANLIAMTRSYRVLKKTGDTAYDRKLGITITSEKLSTVNIVVIIFVVLLSLAINIAGNFAARDDFKDDLRDSLLEEIAQNTLTVQEELDALVVELKGEMELPQMVDDDTQLFDLGSDKKKFIYFYKFPNYNYDDLDLSYFLESLETNMKPTQKDFYCNDENLLWYRVNDIALEYRYSSADDVVIGENIHYSWQCQ